MAVTVNELGETLVTQLYEIITGGDDNVQPMTDNFISWFQPGIVFEPDEFDFCWKGTGDADAEESRRLTNQAFSLAQIVDFIPDREGLYDGEMQQVMHHPDAGMRISTIYGEILRFAKVVKADLTAQELEKIEKFRKLLRVTKQVKDIITDEVTEVTEDGPVLKAYNARLADYVTAAIAYNARRVAAQTATGPTGGAAVLDWTNNAHLYRLQVKAAEDAWISGGYRNEVDKINAFINQVTQRDLLLWVRQLQEYYDDGVMTGAGGAGQRFHFTTLVPGKFAKAAGWTKVEINHTSARSNTYTKSNSWETKADANFKLWKANAAGSGKYSRTSESESVSSFKLTLEVAPTFIVRSWMYPEFFDNRGWTLRPGEGWQYEDMPSDGKMPPSGKMIGYPTMLIFARNIVIESAEFCSYYREFSREAGGEGQVGWGPINLSGKYGSASSGKTMRSVEDGQKLSVPGLQAVACVNHLIGKAPNPLESLDDDDFQ